MTQLKACCNNCGYVGMYEIPYRALVTAALPDVSDFSYYETEDGRRIALNCLNCGWNKLETVYWDHPRRMDPFAGNGVQKVAEGPVI